MPGPEFFQTVMGRQFYDGTMPSIARSLEKLANPQMSLDGLIGRKATFNNEDDELEGVVRHVTLHEKKGEFFLVLEAETGALYTRTTSEVALKK
jgi:hypothetical protein